MNTTTTLPLVPQMVTLLDAVNVPDAPRQSDVQPHIAPAPSRKRSKGDIAMLPVGVVLAVGAAFAGATVLGLFKAHADAGPFTGTEGDHSAVAFQADGTSVGVTGPVFSAGKLAELMCSNMEQGKESEDQAIASGVQAADIDVPTATYVVRSAEFHFCPDLFKGSVTVPTSAAEKIAI